VEAAIAGFVLIIVISVVGLVASVGLPSLLLPKFVDKPTGLAFQIQVVDDQGIPIPNATVMVGAATGQTDFDGSCEIVHEFLGKGLKGLTGTCRLEGNLRVQAPGFTSWERPLIDLFGRHYNYFGKGTNLTQEVSLFR
jgi:hypothetical protein